MQWQTPSYPQRNGKTESAESVSGPRADQGIGQALRSAYLPYGQDLPRDMAALLDKLN